MSALNRRAVAIDANLNGVYRHGVMAKDEKDKSPDGGDAARRTFPLSSFNGAEPPAPEWFHNALATPSRDATTAVQGAQIAWRRWGEAGKRGLVFVHGGVAHMGWWDFVAPFFIDMWSPVALSLSGMGDSGRRDAYHFDTYTEEVEAVAEAAGLFEGPPPVVVGHSLGGFVTLGTAARYGALFGGAVICDSPIRPPKERPPRTKARTRGARIYRSREEALARFRLLPDQDCDNAFLVDHVARGALTPADHPDGGDGWAWKHDPDVWVKMTFSDTEPSDTVGEATCPLAAIRGGDSALVTDDVWAGMKRIFGDDAPLITVPAARHHLMLDEPLAFVSALRGLLAGWARA